MLMTTTFCIVTSSYAQDCKIIETLDNGELIIECAGVKHRTVSPAHIKEILANNAKLESQIIQIDLLNQKVKLLQDRDALRNEEREIARQKLELEQQRTSLYKELADVTTARLRQSEQVLKDGKFKGFFKSVWVDIAKVVISVATLILAK